MEVEWGGVDLSLVTCLYINVHAMILLSVRQFCYQQSAEFCPV